MLAFTSNLKLQKQLIMGYNPIQCHLDCCCFIIIVITLSYTYMYATKIDPLAEGFF